MILNIKNRQLIILIILSSLIGCSARNDAEKLVNEMVETNQEYRPYLVSVKQAYSKELNLIKRLVDDQQSTIKEAGKFLQQSSASRAKTQYLLANSQVELSYFTTLNTINLYLTDFQVELNAKVEESLNTLKQEVIKFEKKAQSAKIKMNNHPHDNVLKQKYSEAAAKYFSRLIRFNKIEKECLQTITLQVKKLLDEYQTKLMFTKHKYNGALEQAYTTYNSSLTNAITEAVTETSIESTIKSTNPSLADYQGLTAHFDNLTIYQELNSDAAKSLKNYFYITGFGAESLLADALKTFGKSSVSQLFNPEPFDTNLFDIKNDGKALLKAVIGNIPDNFDKLKDTAKKSFEEITDDFLKNGKSMLNNSLDKTIKKFI